MAESGFENVAQGVGNIAQVRDVDVDGSEGSAGHVELVSKADIDIRDLRVGSLAARPLCQSLEQLLRRDEKMGNALFDLRQGQAGIGESLQKCQRIALSQLYRRRIRELLRGRAEKRLEKMGGYAACRPSMGKITKKKKGGERMGQLTSRGWRLEPAG